MSGLFLLALLLYGLPASGRDRLTRRNWGKWLAWWSWRHSLILFPLRLAMYGGVIVYAAAGLSLCGVPRTLRQAVGIIPYVLVVESLPGTGGMGERETALVYLVDPDPDHRASVLAFGLIWSLAGILVRIAIGLVSWALPRKQQADQERPRETDASPQPAMAAG